VDVFLLEHALLVEELHVQQIVSFEDTLHAFIECPQAFQVRCAAHLWEDMKKALSNNYCMEETCFVLLQQLHSSQSTRFAAILWSLWKHQNLKLCQKVDEMTSQVLEHLVHLLED